MNSGAFSLHQRSICHSNWHISYVNNKQNWHEKVSWTYNDKYYIIMYKSISVEDLTYFYYRELPMKY